MNPIETAVLPLKEDAIKRARQFALEAVEKIRKDLEANGWDINKTAPHPRSWGVGRNEYHRQLAKYHLYHSVTRWHESSHRPGNPCLVYIADDRVEKFVKDNEEDAAAQYDAYVAKLNHKIGETTKAKLDGNHVWAESFLTVTIPSGDEQVWKTQMICNFSKFGKPFNQFPTRQLKKGNGKFRLK